MNGDLQTRPRRSLHEIWRTERAAILADQQAAYRLVKKANGAGEHLLALEIVETALAEAGNADAVPLLQQKGRALAVLGSVDEARLTLENLPLGRLDDSETLGLLGRVFKDLAASASDAAEKRQLLTDAQGRYQQGFNHAREVGNRDGVEYCGINAASMSALLDDAELANKLAEETAQFAGADDDYYSIATQAEAALILRREEDACRLYRRAFELAEGKKNWGDLASTKKQCRALAMKVYGRRNKFDDCFPVRAVAIFAGHMIDKPGRKALRFPSSSEQSVQQRIQDWIAANNARLSFSSAAGGSDVIFLETAQAAGVETHVVLPFAVDDFIESSVRPSAEEWIARFEKVWERAASRTILNDEVADEKSSVFDFTNQMIAAKAALRGSALDFPKAALAVWDGRLGDGGGGTADAVSCWCKAKIPVHVIHPMVASNDGPVSGVLSDEISGRSIPFDRTQTALPTEYRTSVCAILHVYFASYFALRESEHYAFRETVLNGMANTLAVTSYPPASRYGFGPDYVFAFDSPRAAGIFAGEMLRAITEAISGSTELAIEVPRFCLHAGPVQLMVNPVLNQYSHEGATLTRAGRVVRHLEPGSVYCTEAFAALAALDATTDFRFEYAGTKTYTEEPGQDRLFSVRFK